MTENTKFDFDDITLVPEIISTIRHRSEVNPFIKVDGKDFLPLMTAPMDTVVNDKNSNLFKKNKILVSYPRHVNGISSFESTFMSISLDQAKDLSKKKSYGEGFCYVIDIANGHMQELVDIVKDFRTNRRDVKLIVGNIANPQTYKIFAELDVYGCRVGIGGGGACTTSANVSIHYPMGSLISECYDIKKTGYSTKIISDGGMRKYSDIIKSLALGADIVMIGSMFNKMLQSCSETYLWKKFKVSGSLEQWLFNHDFSLYKKFRGMSTKEVQKHWGKEKLTTSEGIVKWNEVLYDLDGWVINFEDYLRSAMSYTCSYNLDQFKDSHKVLITPNAYKRFSK
jgi:IMP dehydrogenase/GMP reductase